MADKPDMAPAADVYAPATPQLWVALLNWIGFFFQIFAQIARGTPSLTQVRAFLRFRTNSFISSPPPEFRPLPTGDLSGFPQPEEALPPLPVTVQPPTIPAGRVPACCAEELPLPRLKVVLDLDETLVCAYDKSTLPSIIKTEATKAGLKWFELECISSNKESDGRPMTSHVTVFERPGLHEFLKQLSTFADLVLFTAGLEGYARPLVDKIDLENRFILRLYRPSTISTDYREHVKDLCCISKDLSRIVIVDNNPFSFLLQPLNGIPCIPFSAGQPHDEQLLKVLLPLLKHLSHQKDVRHVLNDRFHMPEWFQKQGIPCSGLTK